jgi:hypothetical protein
LPTGFEERGSEWRMLDALTFKEFFYGRYSAAFFLRDQGYVDVLRSCLFEREAHELAPSLNSRPVVELIDHD